MATRYGLDGPGSNPDGGETFHICLDRFWGPPNLLYNGYRVSFPGAKRQGRGVPVRGGRYDYLHRSPEHLVTPLIILFVVVMLTVIRMNQLALVSRLCILL